MDDQIFGAGVTHGAIIGHDENVRAISSGFSLKAGEGQSIVNLF